MTIVLVRHGETEWSASGRHTSRTDVPLTDAGREAARQLGRRLSGRAFALVLSSPRSRARDTAAEAGFGERAEVTEDLAEWDYGGYEGLTTPQIQKDRPGWFLWRDGVVPGDARHPGETVDEVGARTDRVLSRAAELLPDGDVVLVAHGHVLRVLTARWLRLPASDGKLFRLDTSTISALGTEHDEPVIARWNAPPAA